MSVIDQTRGRVDLSILAVDEKRDIAILEMNDELQEKSNAVAEVLESVPDDQALWTNQDDKDNVENEEWVPESVSSSSLFEELEKERAL